MARFTYDATGLAQPGSDTNVSEESTAQKHMVVLSTAGDATVEVNIEFSGTTASWADNKGANLGFLTSGAWNRMPQDAAYIWVRSASSAYAVVVPSDGGVRTSHRTSAHDGSHVYIRDVEQDGADGPAA